MFPVVNRGKPNHIGDGRVLPEEKVKTEHAVLLRGQTGAKARQRRYRCGWKNRSEGGESTAADEFVDD